MANQYEGFEIQSLPAALGIAAVFIASQVLYWWLFISFSSSLPVLLYPLLTLILAGGIFFLVGNLIPGVLIADVRTVFSMTCILTLVNAILGSLLSLDLDSQFDSNVTQKLVAKRGNPTRTDVPGFLFLEIDGLSEKVFRLALEKGHMPTLKNWLDKGTHKVLGWETDFTCQTGAMQSGILMGNNEDIPAYRWWDRLHQRMVVAGRLRDAAEVEERVSSGQGLLTNGGSSRGNMFSGDATESLFTFSTLLDPRRDRGPGFYLYLVSPFVLARLITRFLTGVLREWWQALRQRLRKDKHIINARNFFYAFFRAAVGPFLQDLTTYIVISDVLRGLPSIYAMYVEYDDVSHYAGMETPEAYGVLKEIDRYFLRIEQALRRAPRPYHIIILSDHGQSNGPTFRAAHGTTLEHLVKGSIKGDNKVFASLNTYEAWDNINAFLSESINANTRTAHILRTMLRSKTKDGVVEFGPERNQKNVRKEETSVKEAQVIVLASGCTGLIYFTESSQRATYEEIQNRYPELILNLTLHPGIGFVLVRSCEQGDMALGREGIYFLDQGTVEGIDPLIDYPENSAALLKRESSFSNCPDIIVNTRYNPLTEELCSFENQVSHHGGLGGSQNYPFIFYPATLPVESNPIIGATGVYRLFRGWRDVVQSSTIPTDVNLQKE